MHHSILIAHNFIQLPLGEKGKLPTSVLVTLMSNISYYGYALSLRAFEMLQQSNEARVRTWWNEIEPVLKSITGDDRKMDDFVVYKNFPQEVLDKTESEYWLNQIAMYWGFPNEWFTTEAKERPALQEEMSVRVLHPAFEQTLATIAGELLAMPYAWTTDQWTYIDYLLNEWIRRDKPDAWPHFLDSSIIPFNENKIRLIRLLMEKKYPVRVSSATDVLRLAVALSDGDIGLNEVSPLISFRRSQRRAMLDMLEHSTALEEDLVRYKSRWKKLFFALRPGDYAKRFPRVLRAYDALYNNALPLTFNGRLEAAFLKNDASTVLELLQQRPGEFLRRLHTCILRFGMDTVEAWRNVLPRLTVIQLVRIYRYLETVNRQSSRVFTPKGSWAKVQIVPNTKERKIPKEIRSQLLLEIGIELEERLRPFVPSVDLDECTRRIKLQTNANELTPYGPGTVFTIPENVTFMRTANYWKADTKNGNVWFDNGWNFFDTDWNGLGTCCWNYTYLDGKSACFSGDPTNSKELEGRACQMIDLYLEPLRKSGVRYAVWNVLCYSQITFAEAEDVFAALQWGESAPNGKLFEPSRCQLSFALTSNHYTKFVAYIDLEERKLVYLNANLRASTGSAGENIDVLSQQMPALIEYLERIPSVYDVFQHQVRDTEKGLPVLYSDANHTLEGEKAYVFQMENQHNTFEPFQLDSLFSLKKS